MTMALDVVAFLGRAMDDAMAMNFAGLYYPVTGSVIAGAPRAIRKGQERVGRSYTALHPRRCSSISKVLTLFV